MVKRTKQRTPLEEGIFGQYKYLKDMPRSGRPKVISSETSKQLRDAVLQDEVHQDMTFVEVAQELGIKAARSTIENVLHKEHEIFRYTPRIKPVLNAGCEQLRVTFATWALRKLNEGAIFVFTDETWIELGNGR